MFMSKFIRLCLTGLLLFATAKYALAQHEIHHIPPWINPDGYNPDLVQPFIEPFTFESDLQFFAPAPSDRLDSEIEPSIGWFATYDRTRMFVTRSETEPAPNVGDATWGNRFDLGYMTDEGHGWLVSFLHIDGPNAYNIVEVERINVVEGRDQINIPPGTIILRGTASAQQQQGAIVPGLPIRDRNDPVTNQRDYRLRDSLNVADLTSTEVNKVFRIDPLHYGSIIEPFVGVRYLNLNDYTQDDVYTRYDTLTGTLVYSSAFPVFPPPPALTTIGVEQIDSVQTRFDNHMYAGQIGMRWHKQKSRWNLSGEVRAFAGQNYQRYERRLNVERTIYAAGVAPTTVSGVLYHQEVTNASSEEFIFGTEIRAEAAYDITKYIQLRTGVQFMDFARGVARGDNPLRNEEDLIMIGWTFGATVNR